MKLIRKLFIKRKIQDELGQDDWRKLAQREERNEIVWLIMVCIICGIFVGIFLVYFK